MYQQGLPFEDEFGLDSKEPKYEEVGMEEIQHERYSGSAHAAHVMMYCPADLIAMKVHNVRAYVLMQLRFDGHIGFPGGLLEPGETPEEAIAREVEEEFGYPRKSFKLYKDDHIISYYSAEKDLFLHLFSKEVNQDLLVAIESAALKNDRFGDEVMGLIRVPLYTMADGFRGFPAFLTNRFVGHTKQQLLVALLKKGIMKQEELDAALSAKPLYLEKLKLNKKGLQKC